MKILLTAINAKYIHSNLAVYSLKAYAEKYLVEAEAEEEGKKDTQPKKTAEDKSKAGGSETKDSGIELAEYTINQPVDQILMDLYRKTPDVLCFSCYLWNITYVEQIVRELHKVLPETEIWLGGPEVSWNAGAVLRKLPQVRGVMRGEGEETFLELVRLYKARERHEKQIAGQQVNGQGNRDGSSQGKMPQDNLVKDLKRIQGLAFRMKPEEEQTECPDNWKNAGTSGQSKECDEIICTSDRPVMKDLNAIPFVYHHIEEFEHKIIYYESSRGCPFSCSYCLSSIDKCLRFRNLELVKKELQFFIDHKVSQVKFVDRTFNCRHEHALAIWRYLAEHDEGVTNFHFEVAADLLNEEELELIASMRPGLIQLEIGIQSVNEATIREIRRTMKFDKVAEIVRRIQKNGNIHQHLDLIAGLPYEDYESFRRSFNEVYALKPEQLQLGFLKVLKGSYMEEQAEAYQLIYQERPPFEVLSTKWLPYDDVIRLKGVEEMVEVYYNSRQFEKTLELLEQESVDAFSVFEVLWAYYEKNGLSGLNHNRINRYEILADFIRLYPQNLHGFAKALTEAVEVRLERYRESLTYDLYLRENIKNRPAFAGAETVDKETAGAFYEREEKERRYLHGYGQYDKRQMRKMTHLERIGGNLLLFDYRNRNPLTNQASVFSVSETCKTAGRSIK